MANFYPRPPRGGRPDVTVQPLGAGVFLSTPSARRATFSTWRPLISQGISIHALREEGDLRYGGVHRRCDISIHALREEGDITDHSAYLAGAIFLSTPSARRATEHGGLIRSDGTISIHALREEGDFLRWSPDCRDQNFYPRPPRGGRRVASSPSGKQFLFLSTPSARRATPSFLFLSLAIIISIHALREEGDLVSAVALSKFCKFLSTPSARRATKMGRRGKGVELFLSTPSARRATASSR